MANRGLNDEAKAAFEEIRQDIPEIKGMLIATLDGLPLAADVKGAVSSEKMAALTATAIGVGKRVTASLTMGDLTEVVISSAEGKLFLYLIGTSAVLCLLAPKNVNLGMIFLKAGEISTRLAAVI